jgi:hypothetical protein
MSNDKDPAFIRASALTEVDKKLLDGNANKHLHLIIMEDPFHKTKERTFFTYTVDKGNFGVEFKGYEVNKKTIGQIKTWTEALKYAESEKIEMISLFIPWHRVVKVQNLSYRPK